MSSSSSLSASSKTNKRMEDVVRSPISISCLIRPINTAKLYQHCLTKSKIIYFNTIIYTVNILYIVKFWPSGKYVHLLYMYSILGRGSFCFNYCLNSAWRGGDQFVALLRWYGSPGFFDSGLQLICIFQVSCFSFSSWQYPIDSLWGSGLVSLLASQAIHL